jgi:hypothetical protein
MRNSTSCFAFLLALATGSACAVQPSRRKSIVAPHGPDWRFVAGGSAVCPLAAGAETDTVFYAGYAGDGVASLRTLSLSVNVQAFDGVDGPRVIESPPLPPGNSAVLEAHPEWANERFRPLGEHP